MNYNVELITNKMFDSLSNEHKQNINKEAFQDISNVLVNFHYAENALYTTKQVCNASMGHGKSSAIIAYLKWNKDQPILLSVREKQLAHEIYKEVSKVNKSIINISADNKELYENDLFNYQIVIIQHERLKNLACGFGNVFNYQYYKSGKSKIKRKLMIDEKPLLVDSVIYDISIQNNALTWFEDLAAPFKYKPLTLQNYKLILLSLVSVQTVANNTDVTTPLENNDTVKKVKIKELVKFLNEMKDHPDNSNKYTSLNALKHFKKLLKVNGYGRIDDYTYNGTGRRIIVSKHIDYNCLKMNLIVFDGTASIANLQYINYELINITNRNDYSRLYLYNDNINTSLYARTKNNQTTQKTIANRISTLKHIHNDVFVLPMKDDINVYYKEGAITDKSIHYYKDNPMQQLKGINLLNTTGKNVLSNVTDLYITCLPKRNAEHYKEIAISIYDNDVLLLTSENDTNSWFHDEKLENIYKCEMYSELLQIIHRTMLRMIDSKQTINIYIAYQDSKNGNLLDDINRIYCNDKANVPPTYKLNNMYDYGRNEKLDEFIEILNSKLFWGQLPLSKVSNSFQRYINRHYETKKEMIDAYLLRHNYRIVEIKDRYSDKSKYIECTD